MIERNYIAGNYFGIFLFTSAAFYGELISSKILVQNNTIESNDVGIAILNPYSSITVTNNNINKNSINIRLTDQAVSDVNASNNWWGTVAASSIENSIHDFYDGDFDLGKVNYTPFLTGENPQAMPDSNAPIPSFETSTLPNENSTSTTDQSSNEETSELDLNGTMIVIGILIAVIVLVAVGIILLHRKK